MKSSPYSPHYEKLQSWLKEQRGKSGYSQREVSEIMNRHHSIVGKIEQSRKKIELLEFVKYCQILGADPHEGLAVLMESIQDDE